MCSIKPLILLALCCLHTGLSAVQISFDTKERRIRMEPTQNDARASYTLTNNGEEAFRIEKIKTSCGCTGSIVDNKLVQPGETATIIGTFSKGKRDGINRNKLDVYIEGITKPIVTLSMIVEVPTLVEMTPKIVYWNQKTPKTPQSISVSLDQEYGLTLNTLEYDTEILNIEINRDLESEGKLTLILTPKSYESSLRTTMTLFAKGKEGLEVEGRAHIFVQP